MWHIGVEDVIINFGPFSVKTCRVFENASLKSSSILEAKYLALLYSMQKSVTVS